MINLNKPLFTLSGHKVEVLKTDLKGRYAIVGVITHPDDTQEVETWTTEGKYHSDRTPATMDLTNDYHPEE